MMIVGFMGALLVFSHAAVALLFFLLGEQSGTWREKAGLTSVADEPAR